MNFLVDAQLPRRMAAWFTAGGGNAIHTLDLPNANKSSDEQVNDIAALQARIEKKCSSHKFRWRVGKLRVSSGQDACAILLRLGFAQVRLRGSHIIMQRVKKSRQDAGLRPVQGIRTVASRDWPKNELRGRDCPAGGVGGHAIQ